MVESWLRVSPPIQRYREPYQRNAKPGRANDEATMTAVSSSGVFFFLLRWWVSAGRVFLLCRTGRCP